MELTERDRELIVALQEGLPLSPRPYADLGARCGMDEDEVIRRIDKLNRAGAIKRFGVVVRHHFLGYQANAMVVWDIPDDRVADVGRRFSGFDFVTLCYRRPRRLPDWPYNLFCMIHGRERESVVQQAKQLEKACGIQDIRSEILFSRKQFKQRGAHYASRPEFSHG